MKRIIYFLLIASGVLLASESYIATCEVKDVENFYEDDNNVSKKMKKVLSLKMIYSDGKAKGNMDDTITIISDMMGTFELGLGSPRRHVSLFFPKEKQYFKFPMVYGLLDNRDLITITPLVKITYECKTIK